MTTSKASHSHSAHPRDALFAGEKPFPALPACDHYAGNERRIERALALQREKGPIFDVTCDCEDGAEPGHEKRHAEMVGAMIGSEANAFGRVGARIHDHGHPHWTKDVEIILKAGGRKIAFFTLPKCTSQQQVNEMAGFIHDTARHLKLGRTIPVHVLVETHGALHDAWRIASTPGVETLDFGLMDFVAGHHGAIPAQAMRSPGQFEHPLVVRAKAEVVAAALAHGVVPAHNVSLDLDNSYNVFRDAWRARHHFGFLRMWSIHPSQVQPIVDAMRPEMGEVETAASILLAAQRSGWGPIRHAGELHDRATYRYYWELLQKARVTGVAVPDEAVHAFFDEGTPSKP